jgi:UDP-N-acetyl-D-glucosamine dehydrogenase
VRGARILLLGVTYKPDISDRRESPADPLARRLLTWGADLTYHDPHVSSWDVRAPEGPLTLDRVADLQAEVAAADVVVLLQRHREYDAESLGSWARCLLDTRGAVAESASVARL